MGKGRIGMLLVLLSTGAAPALAQDVAEGPAVGVAVVIAARLNLRSAPSLDGAVVGSVQRGDSVCVAGREADWLRVRRRRIMSANPEAPVPAAASASPEELFAARGFLSETRLSREELQAIGC